MPKLNPNKAPEGYVAVKHDPIDCSGCAFRFEEGSCSQRTCAGPDRKDGTWVIFHPKPTKHVRQPREWMAWAVVGDWEGWHISHNIDPTRDKAIERQRGAACGGNLIRVKITEVL